MFSSAARLIFLLSLIVLSLQSFEARAEADWRSFAEKEYGLEKGAKIHAFLKPLCGNCETLVNRPGISAHFEEIRTKFAETPTKVFSDAQACLDWITQLLGPIRVYRGLALNRQEFEKIIREGSMAATRTADLLPNSSKKTAVLQHLLKMPGEATPVLSVTSYPDVAAIVAKGYAEHTASFNAKTTFKPDTRVYLFEFELPRIDVWGYVDAFGPLPREMPPVGTTMMLENNGSKR